MTRRWACLRPQAVGAQVEELLAVDLGDRRRVGAAHVVGLDLQAGDGVGVGARGEQQVARLLEGVGLLGAGVDADHAAPYRRGPAVQQAPEGQVAGRVGRRVLLGGVEVEVLAAAADVGAGDLGLRAPAGEVGLHAHLAAGRAEPERDPLQRPVAVDLGALGAEDPRLLGQRLGADVAQPRARPHDELGHGVEQAAEVGGGREVLLPDLGLGALLDHDQRAPVGAALGGSLDRARDHGPVGDHAGADVHEQPAGPLGVVARGEGIALAGDDGAEVALDELRALGHGLGQRHGGDPVGHGDVVEDRVAAGGLGRRGREGVEVEAAEVGELPARHGGVGERELRTRSGGALPARRQPAGFGRSRGHGITGTIG